MKHLFVVRHGDYEGENLSFEGKNQVELLARQMKQIIEEIHNEHYILSSPSPRTKQTAGIIAEVFDLDGLDEDDLLCDEFYSQITLGHLMDIGELLDKRDEDLAIVVTHARIGGRFSQYCLEKKLQNKEFLPQMKLGNAIYFNLEEKVYKILPE